jgi:hypothetical protein
MRSGIILIAPLLLAGLSLPASAVELSPFVSLTGFVEARLAWNDGPLSWERGGLGKISFGGDGGARTVGHAEAAAVLIADLGWNIRGEVNVSADPRRDGNPLDLIEGFLRYESGPSRPTRFHAKAGAFFPPVSLENTGLAWTSPFTLSSSAINTWIGEEMRTFGAEVGVTHRFDGGRIGIAGAVFGANDPVGVLLAWRGWTVSDREAGTFDRLPLAPLHVISAAGPIPQQAPWFELRYEIDQRPGVYLSIEGAFEDLGEANILLYDNRARDTAFDGFQYAWHTRFAAVGARIFTANDLDVIAQGMVGETTMGTPAPGMSLVNAGFASAFVLVSRSWDRHRVSARVEYFETTDRDVTEIDNNAEHGMALTAAYIFRPAERHRLTIELMRVVSSRPERAHLNLGIKARETQAQASYRIFF